MTTTTWSQLKVNDWILCPVTGRPEQVTAVKPKRRGMRWVRTTCHDHNRPAAEQLQTPTPDTDRSGLMPSPKSDRTPRLTKVQLRYLEAADIRGTLKQGWGGYSSTLTVRILEERGLLTLQRFPGSSPSWEAQVTKAGQAVVDAEFEKAAKNLYGEEN